MMKKEIDINLDYSNSFGIGFSFDTEGKTVTYKLGNGIQDISFVLTDEKALEFLELQIKDIYGEDTLKELEDKNLELVARIEDLNNKIEQYEEYIDHMKRR